MREELARRHPDDGVLGEEEAETVGTSGRRWVLDPIDGTKAFTQGVPLYTNLLAVEDEHGLAVGVVNVPALGETVWAGRGRGLLLQRPAGPGERPRRISPAPTCRRAASPRGPTTRWPRPAARRSTCGRGVTATATCWSRPGAWRRWSTRWPPTTTSRRCRSSSQEAGGRFTDLDGHEGPGHGSGVASNGRVHDDLLALLGGHAARVDTVLG